jgi:hypothetical protein
MTDHFHNWYIIRNDNSSTAANAIGCVHEVSCKRRSPLRLFIKFRLFLLVLIGPVGIKRAMG